MGIQTTVSAAPAAAYEGQTKGDVFEESANAEADLTNGRLVVLGTNDKGAKLPAAAGDVTGKTLGITRYQASRMVNWPSGVTVPFPNGTTVPVIRRGKIWVKVEEAVAPGDPVFARHTAGAGGTTIGAFRKSADTATAAQVPSAVYRTTAAINGLALVEINLV